MGLRLQQDNNGTIRPNWWGRICVKGKRHDTDLKVPIEGTIPRDADGRISLTLKGDAAFEKSRKAAHKALERWRKESQHDPAELQRKAYKARTGDSLEGVPLAKLADLWIKQKRTYTPTDNWKSAIKTWFDRFSTFAARYANEHNVKCETINDITPDLVSAWFDDLKSEFAWETVSKQMSLLRGAFRRYSTNGRPNPFEDIVMRNRETGNARVNHKPLTATELDQLFSVAQKDALLYPLIVTAACTGMRIGDVCQLKWEDIDLREGLIDVVTAKAGIRATIPILKRLREVLIERDNTPGDGQTPSPFVFPAAAAQYQTNPDKLYQDVKPLFAQAINVNKPTPARLVALDGQPQPIRSLADALKGTHLTATRKARLFEVYDKFKSGMKSKELAETLHMPKSQISMDLATLEKLTGEELRPRATARKNRLTRLALADKTRMDRGIGKRSASLYGWHSLRATFVVLAVEAGVPLPDVQKIVGHTTADMTMQYFNPTKLHAAERIRRQLSGTVLNAKPTQTALTAPANIPASVWAILTDEQKAQLTKTGH